MLLPRLGALLLASSAVQAYQDGSPFFLVSTDPLPPDAPLRSTQIARTLDVEDQLARTLAECSESLYTIYSQRRVSELDFKGNDGFPKTRMRLRQAKEGSVVEIPSVGVGEDISAERIEARLRAACASNGKRVVNAGDVLGSDTVAISHYMMEDLPSDEKQRKKVAASSDNDLERQIEAVGTSKNGKAVFIYVTTIKGSSAVNDGGLYEMDEPYPSSMHIDLKRDVYPRQSNSTEDAQAGLPLFEKYQFLTPGIFMGLFVSVILILILYVALSAIAGLEVSYAAFTKEMGAQAQKSKQQ